jgi:hypothetical protein
MLAVGPAAATVGEALQAIACFLDMGRCVQACTPWPMRAMPHCAPLPDGRKGWLREVEHAAGRHRASWFWT